MFDCPGLISSEMRYPTETSKKKKRYVTFICSVCGKTEEQIYMKSRYSGKCRSCVQHNLDTKGFIAIGIKHFGEKYDYSKVKFIGVTNDVVIICPIHGEFTQRAWEHIQGHGCLQCAREQRKIDYLLPKKVWVERIKQYPLVQFKDLNQIKNYHGYVDFTCQIHGDFTSQLGQVGQTKHLCVQCAWVAHQLQSVRPEHIGKPTHLYYVYLPDIDMYKFGVTINKEERFRQLGTVQVIATGIKEYTEAIRLEHKVMLDLDQYRYKGRQLLIKEGSTELFKVNVIKQIKRALQE